MKWPGGWLWELKSCWGSHPRTTVKMSQAHMSFHVFLLGPPPMGERAMGEKKNIYIYIIKYIHIDIYRQYIMMMMMMITA